MTPVTVITPTYRVGDDLWKFVLSVQKQLLEGDELIIIDNDKSAYATEIAALENVHYHKYPENRGPCPARNYGASLSNNEWLLFLDDDGLAPDDMLEALKNIIRKNPDFYAIRGKIIPKNDHIYNHMQSHYDMGDRSMPYILNLEGITAIRKKEFDTVGGWNDDLYGHEGLELTYRLLDRFGPENCQYHPELALRHDYSDSLLKYLKKANRHNDTKKKWKDKYKHLNPIFNGYKRLPPQLHESIKTLPRSKQRKIRFILWLKDICKRHPRLKRILFAFLQGFNNIGIKI